MKPRTPKRFWKIRDKRTKLFVVKSHRYNYRHYRDQELAARVKAADEAKENYSPYAILGIVGKTYSTKSGAMSMLSTLANMIDGRDAFDHVKREDVVKVAEPYFELVEYEVREVVPTPTTVETHQLPSILDEKDSIPLQDLLARMAAALQPRTESED